MVILHISKIKDNLCSGVDVIVPEHIKAQQIIETVGFVNVANIKIEGIQNQFTFCAKDFFNSLPAPFSKPDLIVFHQLYIFDFLNIAKQAKNKKIPYVIVPHGSLTKEIQKVHWVKKKLGNLLFFNKFIKQARAVQYLSKGEEAMSFKKFPAICTTNGIAMPNITKTAFHENEIVFTYIGRYDIYVKGLDILLGAIRQKRDFLIKMNCRFDLYGPHTDYYIDNINKLKQLIIQYNIDDLVNINGPAIGLEKKNILLNTDVFIQVSRTEAMGISIAEALSYGVPALVTTTTTMGEIVEQYNAGWSCMPTINSIVIALENAVNQKITYLEKSKKAIKLVEDNFLWESVVREILFNYQKLLGWR